MLYLFTLHDTPGLGDFYTNRGITISHSSFSLPTLIQEASHALDWNGKPGMSPFIPSELWQANWAADPHIPSFYTVTNWRENFAENGMYALYDACVPGGFTGIQSN